MALLSAQYLARCLDPENVCHSITIRTPPPPPAKRRMKETLSPKHRNTVDPVMIANDMKITLQSIHNDAVIKAANSQERM